MAIKFIDDSILTAIANAIRTKLSSSDTYKPSEMATAIGSISGGITPTGTKQINTNGTHDVTAYASAEVNVPNSYSAGDEGKVVSNGALVAQTSDSVTQNGTVDTTLINSLTVNVSGGSSEVVLGTGSYTKADTGVSLVIPVTYTSGTITKILVYAPTPLVSTGQTYAWYIEHVNGTDFTAANISDVVMARYLNSSNAYGNGIGYPSLSANGTTITCGRISSAYPVQQNTYTWIIWGTTS